MQTVGLLLIASGIIVGLIYGIILIIRAFKVSIWWGLGSLLIPFVALVFVFVHWRYAHRPFLMSLLSVPLLVIGMSLSPESFTRYQ